MILIQEGPLESLPKSPKLHRSIMFNSSCSVEHYKFSFRI